MTSTPRVLLFLDHIDARVGKGVKRYANELGWNLEDGSNCVEQLTKLWDWGGDGVIAAPGSLQAARTLSKFIQFRRIPAVSLQPLGAFLGAARVGMDLEAIGRMAAEHLIARGYGRLAMVLFDHDETEMRMLVGFSRIAKREGVSVAAIPVPKVADYVSEDDQALGLLAPSDRKAMSLAATCKHLPEYTPEQIGILGVGNDPSICLLDEPSISSVECDIESLGYEAARLLNALMRGESPRHRDISIQPVKVVERASTRGIRDRVSSVPETKPHSAATQVNC